jgi:hypothetical protein
VIETRSSPQGLSGNGWPKTIDYRNRTGMNMYRTPPGAAYPVDGFTPNQPASLGGDYDRIAWGG